MRRIEKLLLMTLLAVALLPSRAFASTFITSTETYTTDANVAACQYFGYEYLTMDPGLRSLLFNSTTDGGTGTTSNPNYPGYARFRDSLYSREISIGSPIGGGAWAGALRWYSSRDGAMFVDIADKARSDLAKAIRWWDANKEGIGSGGGSSGDNDDVGYWDPVSGSLRMVSTNNYVRTPAIYNNSTIYFWNRSNYVNNNYKAYDDTVTGSIPVVIPDDVRWNNRAYFVDLDGPGANIWTYDPAAIELVYTEDNGVKKLTGLKNVSTQSTVIYNYPDLNSKIDRIANGDTGEIQVTLSLKQSVDSPLNTLTTGLYGHTIGSGLTYDISNMSFVAFANGTGGGGGGGSYEPVEPDPLPPKNPDTPSDPVVPEPPEPGDPVPGPDVDVNPTVNVNYTVTQQSQDYQSIIDAISVVNENIKVISQNLVILEDNIQQEFNGLYELLTNYFQAFMAQHDAWWRWYYEAWEDYVTQIDDWGVWLGDVIEDVRTDFEDFGLRLDTWLEMIYNRLGKGGGPQSKPDPVDDDGGFWEWWNTIIQKVLDSLPEAVTDFLDQIGSLKNVFPFSIPWDVSFILGLFSQPAATPVFDIDMDTQYWQWEAHIDLHQWDNAAAIFRRCVLLVFAVQLAMWTPDVIRNLVDI